MKRLISIVCAMLILLQAALLQLPVLAAENTDDVAKQVEIGLLADLGILAQNKDDITRKLTYAELARIGYMIYIAGEADKNTDFLKMAAEVGIISETVQGDVSLNDAVNVLLRSAYYTSAGKAIDEKLFGNSFRMKIMRGVSVKDSSAITLGEACELTENALMGDQLVFNGVEYTFSDLSVLEAVFHLQKVDGVIFPGKMYDMEDKFVVIDGVEYKTKKDFSSLAGLKVRAYVDEEENILSVDDEYFVNEIYMISANDIEGISGRTIEFTSESGKTVSETLSANVVEVFNGKVQDFNSADFDINNGYITLIRTPGSVAYNVAIIKQYDIMVAGGVANAIIYDCNGLGMTVNLEENDVEVSIALDGNPATEAQIKRHDVLLISYSKDRKQLSVEIVRNSVKGVVTAMNDEIIEIGGEAYVKTAYFKQFAKKVAFGEKVELLLDGAGFAVDFRQSGATGKEFGFFMGMHRGTLGNKAEIKLLTENGTIQVFSLADKVKLNGTSVRRQDSALDVAFKTLVECNAEGVKSSRLVNDYVYQLIIYKLNDEEEVSYIDTAIETDVEADIEKENQLTLDAFVDNGYYKDGPMQIMNGVGLSANTRIFYVPLDCNKFDTDGNLDESLRGAADDEDYEVPVISPLKGNSWDNVLHAYCVSRGGVANAVVVYNPDLTSSPIFTNEDAPVFILSKVRCGLDEDGDTRYILYGYEDGKEITYYMSEELYQTGGLSYLPEEERSLYGNVQPKPGDLLQVRVGNGNKVLSYAIRYSGAKNIDYYPIDNNDWSTFSHYAAYVYDQDENGMITVDSLSTLENKRIAMKNKISAVYIYDLEENKVTKGTVNSAVSYVNSRYNASRVFLDGNHGVIQQMIIFINRENPFN